MNTMIGGRERSSYFWRGHDETLLLALYHKKYFCSKKYMQSTSSPEGCSWGAGYGIIRTPISIVLTPPQPKDVCHVAPPARHRACAGRNRPCGPWDTHPGSNRTKFKRCTSKDANRGAHEGSYFGHFGQARGSNVTYEACEQEGSSHGIRIINEINQEIGRAHV